MKNNKNKNKTSNNIGRKIGDNDMFDPLDQHRIFL